MNEVTCEHAEEQPKPVEVVWVSSKPKKKRPDIAKIVERVISLLLGPAVAIAALLVSLNSRNMDYEYKALAGNIEAQMFLADYHYQIGDFEKSVFYYSMVVDRPKLKTKQEKEYYYGALGNLGYLYYTKIEGKDSRETARNYLVQGMQELVRNKVSMHSHSLVRNYLLLEASFLGYHDAIILDMFPSLEQPDSTSDDVLYWGPFGDEAASKELYDKNPAFKLLIDYNLVQNREEYIMLRAGYWPVDFFYTEEKIEGCISLDEYVQVHYPYAWQLGEDVDVLYEIGITPEWLYTAKGNLIIPSAAPIAAAGQT